MKQLLEVSTDQIVFLDIETVRIVDDLEQDSPLYDSWEYKMRNSEESRKSDYDIFEYFKSKAPLHAEFARVACITVGRIVKGGIKLRTYANEGEHTLLKEFTADLNTVLTKQPKTRMCGHAIVGFDIPFLFRRCLINGIKPSDLIDVGGAKPWEVTAMDTMVMWKATGFSNASLLNIATAFGLPSPKSDIDGSMVSEVFYREGAAGLKRITEYCERDVVTTINIVRKCRFEEPIEDIEVAETVEVIPPTLIEIIKNTGEITPDTAAKLTKVFKGLSKEEKSLGIQVIKAMLVFTGKELDVKLETKLLK